MNIHCLNRNVTGANRHALGTKRKHSGAGAVVSQPLDCVKTRVQTGVMGGARDARALLREIVRAEGVGALWRGAAARVLWLAPGCGVMIATFEAAQRVLEGDAGGRRD